MMSEPLGVLKVSVVEGKSGCIKGVNGMNEEWNERFPGS